MGKKYTTKEEVCLYPGMAAWHFVGVDKKHSADIKEKFASKKRGFGSVPVEVTIGKTKWKTSIFPDKRSGTYLMPLKADVRRKEGIRAKDKITFTIELR